jgi:Mg2+-importing ATPase
MYQKGKNQITVHKTAADMVRRDEANKKLAFAAGNKIKPVLKQLDTALTGLGDKAVISHRIAFGRNKVTHEKKKSLVARLAGAFINPFTAILFCLAVVSIFTDIVVPILLHAPEDVAPLTIIIILTMVFISGTLRFVQESRSGNAAEKLLAMITTTCTVTRKNNGKQEIPLEDLVVGDIIHLSAGDMVPADVRVLEAKDLFISQSALTGESDPIEKIPVVCEQEYDSITDYPNIAFMEAMSSAGVQRRSW